MEKTSRGIVIPLDAGWSDVGSWEVVWETSKKDMKVIILKEKFY